MRGRSGRYRGRRRWGHRDAHSAFEADPIWSWAFPAVERPHYYLSLLGTHPDRRGEGIGMALLADGLELIDAEGMPAYLESSNAVNDPRYERLGFSRIGGFDRPDGRVSVSTMWREPR